MNHQPPDTHMDGLGQIESQDIDLHTKIVSGNTFALLIKLKRTEGLKH